MRPRHIGLALAAFVLVASTQSATAADTYQPNIDRPGSDYTSFNLVGNNPADCQNACVRDSRCRAWTFVKPGVQGPTARCWLKSAIPAPVANGCCVSGRNPNVLIKPPTLLCYENQTNYGALTKGPPAPCRAPINARPGDSCACSNFSFAGIVR